MHRLEACCSLTGELSVALQKVAMICREYCLSVGSRAEAASLSSVTLGDNCLLSWESDPGWPITTRRVRLAGSLLGPAP